MATTVFSPRLYAPRQVGVPVAEARLHEAVVVLADVLAPDVDRPLFVVPELELHGVRPDLWIGHLNSGVFVERARAGIAPCTAPQALAVAHVLRRLGNEATVDRLTSRRYALGDRRRIQRGVSELVARGIAAREGEVVQLASAWRSADPLGVGVEAKTGRWREAVRQVQMWHGLVNAAWLVFPSAYLASLPRGQSGLRGLGIATVDGDQVQIVRKPRRRVGRPFSRLLTEEFLFARWLDENSISPVPGRG